MKKLIVSLLLVGVAGCVSTGKKLNNVSLGMTKPEVVRVMGTPDSVKGADGVEVLVYSVDKLWTTERYTYTGDYWIELKNGRVTKYGKPVDFNMANPPTQKVIIERQGAGY